MEKLLNLISQYSRWDNLRYTCIRIQTFLESDFVVAVESCKALIESVCKTILDDRKIQYTKSTKITPLVTDTINALKFMEHTEQLKCFARGFVTFIKNLAEVRNDINVISHGSSLSDYKEQKLDQVTASFLINSTETLACFLIQYYEIEYPRKEEEKDVVFEDYTEFNDYLDDEYGDIIITDIPYPTSESLYAIDKLAYKDKYQQYLGQKDE